MSTSYHCIVSKSKFRRIKGIYKRHWTADALVVFTFDQTLAMPPEPCCEWSLVTRDKQPSTRLQCPSPPGCRALYVQTLQQVWPRGKEDKPHWKDRTGIRYFLQSKSVSTKTWCSFIKQVQLKCILKYRVHLKTREQHSGYFITLRWQLHKVHCERPSAGEKGNTLQGPLVSESCVRLFTGLPAATISPLEKS